MISKSPEQTRELGERLAKSLGAGDVVALEGELGSGKTCFVQGMAKGLGVSKDAFVRSPSFTLLNQYEGRIPLYHLDFYRLNHAEDLGDLGLEEYFDGKGVTVIEWAHKFIQSLPKRTIHVHFEIIDENTREISGVR